MSIRLFWILLSLPSVSHCSPSFFLSVLSLLSPCSWNVSQNREQNSSFIFTANVHECCDTGGGVVHALMSRERLRQTSKVEPAHKTSGHKHYLCSYHILVCACDRWLQWMQIKSSCKYKRYIAGACRRLFLVWTNIRAGRGRQISEGRGSPSCRQILQSVLATGTSPQKGSPWQSDHSGTHLAGWHYFYYPYYYPY